MCRCPSDYVHKADNVATVAFRNRIVHYQYQEKNQYFSDMVQQNKTFCGYLESVWFVCFPLDGAYNHTYMYNM